MTPQKATKAYSRGKLREGTAVHQPFGFLLGQRNDGRVLSVKCDSNGQVYGLNVQWADETAPSYVPIDDLEFGPDATQPSFGARIRAAFTRHRVQPRM